MLPRPRSALGQLGGALALLIVVVLVAAATGRAVEAAKDFWTGMQYGDPRTNHLVVAFGVTGEAPGRPSLVTAVNAGGDVLIYATIGGKADQTVVLVVPGADPTGGRGAPLLSAADLNGDGTPDLVVGMTTNSAGWLFLSDGTTLRPPTEEELDQIHSGQRP